MVDNKPEHIIETKVEFQNLKYFMSKVEPDLAAAEAPTTKIETSMQKSATKSPQKIEAAEAGGDIVD